MVNITINNKNISVPEDYTILQAASENGIIIPTLCYLEDIHKCGSCRICSVEVVGSKTLVASCISKVRNGMEVYTNTKKVNEARKMLYHLLLSDHSKNCLSCSRNQTCELQKLGAQLGVFETYFNSDSARQKIDKSFSLERDLSKCILCRRCITVCKEIQGVGILGAQHRGFDTVVGPQMDLPIANASCSNCGQCTTVCPVGALKAVSAIDDVWDAINDPDKHVIIQAAPAVRVGIAEMFDNPAGTRATGKLAASMRALGADDIFDTNWAADLTIMEEGTEFLHRVIDTISGKKATLPMITSCSPGWVKFVENYYPEHLDHLSTCKSPHMMLGALAKSYYAEKIEIDPQNIYMVSVMPCTAKKFEITREEMKNDDMFNVDAVLTTRELGYMIKEAGIDFNNIDDEDFDAAMGFSTGAADIFGLTGGVMEAALRTVYTVLTGRALPFENLHVTPIVGLDTVKEGVIKLEGLLPEYSALEGFEVKIAVTSGLIGAKQLMEQIAKGESPYHFIEVMGCPGGCITGGGQPRSDDKDVRKKRMKALYNEDESKTLRESHKNPSIIKLYEEYLTEPGGELSHKYLHTHYIKRGLPLDAFDVDVKDIAKPILPSKSKEQKQGKRVGEELESVRVSALQREIERLREELNEARENAEFFKEIISDYTK